MGPPAADDIEMDVAVAAAARKTDDASLKKRMRIVTEAIVKMVCPFFLAACVSLAKLDMGDQPGVRDSLSPLAGCTLASGILSLLPLTFPSWFPDKLFEFSMFFIHLCGVLLMVLVFLTLFLVTEDYAPLLVLVGVTVIFTINLACHTVFNGYGHAARAPPKYEKYLVDLRKHLDDLENSMDLSAAITFLLFLGLGGLVLGGQYSTIQLRKDTLPEVDKKMLLLLFHTICLSFFVCIAGVLFMLVCMVPPVSANGGSEGICHIIDGLNYFFCGSLTLIVLLITLGTLRKLWVVAFAIVLSVIPFIVWGVLAFPGGAIGEGEEDVKPASLDLTKVTFTGFLAISVYTISENSPVSIRECSSWFIFFTAIAVNNSLGWRLLTHRKKPSVARFTAGNVASLGAHICITAAVVPFACMAFDAFRKITTAAPSPTP